jgi:hypothetical protein
MAVGGVDYFAGMWASARGVDVHTEYAQWKTFGRSAGPRRNAEMLLMKPDTVIAFLTGSGPGTRNMITQAKLAGVHVVEIHDERSHKVGVRIPRCGDAANS